jgi:hypothetical protein
MMPQNIFPGTPEGSGGDDGVEVDEIESNEDQALPRVDVGAQRREIEDAVIIGDDDLDHRHHQSGVRNWSKELLEAGNKRLAGDNGRQQRKM